MLNGKTALITGSSQGIGLGVAQAFAAAGAAVVLTSERPLDSLREVQRLLSDYPRTRYIAATCSLRVNRSDSRMKRGPRSAASTCS